MTKIQSNKGVDVGKNTPIDYVLAGVLGLLGGPVGVAMSIGVIHLLAPYAGAQQKWFVWGLIGMFGVPLSWGILINSISSDQPEWREPQVQEMTNEATPNISSPNSDLGWKSLVSLADSHKKIPGTTRSPIHSNCDPSYPELCLTSSVADLDCGDISARNFQVVGSDPHGFDRDQDGIGCER